MDFNKDGLLDLCYQYNSRNALTLGTNGGGFASPSNLDLSGGWNRAVADYDNDGLPDVIINTAPNQRLVLFKNTGNGAFSPVATGDIANQGSGFYGMAWGDYDNDGFLDLFVSRGPNGEGALFHNERNGTFHKVVGLGEVVTRASWNPNWVDFDNDGYLDLWATRAGTCPIFRNNGDGTFTKVTEGPIGTDQQSDAYGSAWGDYNNDGFMDLFIPNQGGGPNHFYRNDGNGNAWIQFILVGTASNRAALGAKVRLKAVINGVDVWQMREIEATEGYDGAGTLRAEFGLGDAAKADTLRIEWPSGTVQEFHNLAPRQILTIIEPSRLTGAARNPDGSVRFNLIGAARVPFSVESSQNLMNWTPFLTITNKARTEVILDSNPASGTRFYRATGPAPVPFP